MAAFDTWGALGYADMRLSTKRHNLSRFFVCRAVCGQPGGVPFVEKKYIPINKLDGSLKTCLRLEGL